MTSRFFKVFCDMLDRTPVRVVLPIAKAECQMMEDDIAHQRLTPDQDIASVLSFCRFLSTGRADGEEASNVLPLDHFAFYRNTVERLVEAGELPDDAKDKFDTEFLTRLPQSLQPV